jgi:hypothetical protein
MSKTKYIVYDDFNNLDYIIKVKEKDGKTIYKMYRSKGEQWSEQVKGEKLFTLVDDDMDMSIKMHNNEFSNHQYHQTMELRILLNLVNDRTHMADKYKTVKL